MVNREPDFEIRGDQFFFEEMLRVRFQNTHLIPVIEKLVINKGRLNVLRAIGVEGIVACCEVRPDVNACYERWLLRKVVE